MKTANPVLPNSLRPLSIEHKLGIHASPTCVMCYEGAEAELVGAPHQGLALYKVTNLQYLEFIAAGGYENKSFWTADDWAWKAQRAISHPAFWKRTGDQWLYRTMFNEVPLPVDWPVYVSQAEAKAYASWAGKSLAHGSGVAARGLRRRKGNDRQLSMGLRSAVARVRKL